ncbi:MAG: amidohydrolase family protein [Candidatus Hydrogenedentes bacterium]|nr:amidohydrolase family protein [Candidatus Hydrogenedentota bacterium]
MIIDVHAHVYADPLIKPRAGATTFMSAEDQIAVMDKLGVDKAVILPLNCAECPAEPQSIGEVLSICKKYPGRFIPFCNLDPRLAGHPDQLTVESFDHLLGQYKDLGCKGIGEMTARIRWTDNPMLCMLESAEKLGLIITFHTLTPEVNSYGVIDEIGLPGLETVLKQFPDLIVFGHSQAFWSEVSGDVGPDTKNGYPKTPVQPAGVVPRLMRECPGLHGDLSAGSGLNAISRDPGFGYEFIDEFQDRLLLGLDFCSPKNDMQHINWLTAARDGGHISEQAYQKIMWRNANRLLGLNIEED